MWGGPGQSVHVEKPAGAGITFVKGQQLARIDYARPETWSFFLAAQVVNYVGIQQSFVDVTFDLTIGSGRSTQVITAFEHYRLAIGAGAQPNQAGQLIYSTEVSGPNRRFDDATPAANTIRDFCAQSINLTANFSIDTPTAAASCDVLLQAFFAPRSHIRPEWFKDGTFTGGENAGL